jgi:DNA-binding HxlR family transcriptional regulator
MTDEPGGRATRRKAGAPRSTCPIACTLDLLGDRWTLLVVRDLLAGKTRFHQFLASPERIPTNILSDRLRRLEGGGIVRSELYSQHPPRSEYHLTESGRELRPVVRALGAWGLKHIEGTEPGLWLGDAAAHPVRGESEHEQ